MPSRPCGCGHCFSFCRLTRGSPHEDRPGRAALRGRAARASTAAPSGSSPTSPTRWSSSGHDVTLFASADARTKATLVPVRDQAIRLDPAPLKSDLAAHLAMLHEVRRRAARVRRPPLPRRPAALPVLRGHRRAHADHAARPARPRRTCPGSTRAGRSSRWSRSPTTSAGRCPMPTGSPPCTTASTERLSLRPASRGATISPSSAASRRRSGPTARSRSPSARACR